MDDWDAIYAKQLPGQLNERGDLIPPWVKFPTLPFLSIGWRMGRGEDYLGLWRYFAGQLADQVEVRVAYLQRHAPAPKTWAPELCSLFAKDRENSFPADLGLVASDAAYPVWLEQQQGQLSWPWARGLPPDEMAHHNTREFSFQARQLVEARSRGGLPVPEIPSGWEACAQALLTGCLPPLRCEAGLESLALSLCAGKVVTPWSLGCSAQGGKKDYGDAFELWVYRCFDDKEHFSQRLPQELAPEEWRERLGSWLKWLK